MEDGAATIRTRNGHDYSSSFPEIVRAARGLDNCIIDGEACAIDKNGVTTFSALQAATTSDNTHKLILFAFDLLWLQNEDLRTRHLMQRKERLSALLTHVGEGARFQYVDNLDFAGANVMARACELGLEGIVSERMSEPYVSGRTGIWTKAKCRATQHAVVGGWTVSPKGFNGLLLGVYKGKKLIPIGRVGTGFPRLKQLETDVSPFSAPIPRKPGRTIHYAKADLVAGFEMTRWTNDGVIRQAAKKCASERTRVSDRTGQPTGVSIGRVNVSDWGLVFWGTLTTAGEYTFIGYPRGDKAGKVLLSAHSGEVLESAGAHRARLWADNPPDRQRSTALQSLPVGLNFAAACIRKMSQLRSRPTGGGAQPPAPPARRPLTSSSPRNGSYHSSCKPRINPILNTTRGLCRTL